MKPHNSKSGMPWKLERGQGWEVSVSQGAQKIFIFKGGLSNRGGGVILNF